MKTQLAFDVGLEASVLSLYCMLRHEILVEAICEISESDFVDFHHKVIYSGIVELANLGAVDQSSLDAVTKKMGYDLSERIGDLFRAEVDVANKDHLIDLLKGYSLRRRIQDVAKKLNSLDSSLSYSQLIEEADNLLTAAIAEETSSHVEKIGNFSFAERIQELVNNPKEIFGLLTGLHFFDKNLDGIVPGLLTLIGGRPGTGKSALAQNLYFNVGVAQKKPILVIDTETNLAFVENRLLAIASGVSFNDIIHGNVSYDYIEPCIRDIQASPIYYYYMPQLSTQRFSAICKKYKKAYGIEAVFVDFLGSGETENMYLEVGKKVKEMHDVITEQDLGCVVFQQLNREQLDKTTGKSVKEVGLGHFVQSDMSTWFPDSIVGLRYPTTVEKSKFQCNRMADICKHRFGENGNSWPLVFGGGNMRFDSVEVF